MRYLSTLYVTEHQARISHRRGSLTVSTPDATLRIGLETLDNVIIAGGAQITTDAITACVERSIRIAGLRRNGAIRFTIGGPRSGNVHLRTAQHRTAESESTSLEIARMCIAAKLRNSARVVRRWAKDASDPDLARRLSRRAALVIQRAERVPTALNTAQLLGIEGDAARAHFTALGAVLVGTVPFISRTRRPPRDPTNALLSFTYGLVVTEYIGALDSVGLDPQIGFLHRNRSGRPSLALDLVEEVRPLVDRFAVGLLRRHQLTIDDFTTAAGAVYLSDDGRKKLFSLWDAHKSATIPHPLLDREIERAALPAVQATLLARHLRGDLPRYAPYTTPY